VRTRQAFEIQISGFRINRIATTRLCDDDCEEQPHPEPEGPERRSSVQE
jgi:hypothetical protein